MPTCRARTKSTELRLSNDIVSCTDCGVVLWENHCKERNAASEVSAMRSGLTKGLRTTRAEVKEDLIAVQRLTPVSLPG